MHSILWLIILAILIMIEIITVGITTIWFAGGALAAFILSLFSDNLVLELVIFMVVSLALLYFVKPVVMKHIRFGKTGKGYEGVIGKKATVIEAIDYNIGSGKVEVDGQEWSARTQEAMILEKGSTVIVKGISGARLIVIKEAN